MALPIVKVTLPSVLAGQSNGRIAPNLLTRITMPGGGTAEVLAQAAPKWNALLAAAAAAGFAFSHEGDYRTYNEQVALFQQRFTTTYRAGATTRQWNGQTWYLKAGYALAAVPGTSNHGWGLALDLCVVIGGKRVSLASSGGAAALAWLVADEVKYGMSHENSEQWHVRPYDGDSFTPAVLAYQGDDMTPDQERLLANVERILTTAWDGKDAFGVKYSNTDPGRTLPNPFTALAKDLAQPVDLDALAKKVAAELGDTFAAKVADELAARLKD